MEDSDALPLSDEYYTESGEVSNTGTIENTNEASEQDTVSQDNQASYLTHSTGVINLQFKLRIILYNHKEFGHNVLISLIVFIPTFGLHTFQFSIYFKNVVQQLKYI
ncbi:unnamed protein product [Rhizophagus irregularis]|nr:unnamed protein product [Rhizophagus irregularis]